MVRNPTAPPITSIVSLRQHRYGRDPARYPILATTYVITHGSLWGIVFRVACVGCTFAFIILVVLLAFALKPQAELIASNSSPEWWAWLIAVLLVLFEAAICASFVMAYSQAKAQSKVFVATMRLEGQWKENEMRAQSALKDLNVFKKAFFVRVLTKPLEILPLFGAALYSAINATFIGWDYMDRYFDAVRLPSRFQRIEVFGEEKSDCCALLHPSTYDSDNDYARFGFMCAFFESIPLVGWVIFPITNAVAAALFACDIEKYGGPSCLKGEGEDVNGSYGTQN